MAGKRTKTLAQRMEAKSIPITECGCHIWLGYVTENGYGRIGTDEGPPDYAHRVAWQCAHGPIPDGMNVLHKCDVRSCINPDHLFLGSHADNMIDMTAKGRSTRGERHPGVKLNEDEVRAIRASSGRLADIANKFGVSFQLISLIRHRKIWGHIDG